jgi:hypothetical protein
MYLHTPLYFLNGVFYLSPPGILVVAYITEDMRLDAGVAYVNDVRINFFLNNPYNVGGLYRSKTIRPRPFKPSFQNLILPCKL